MLSDERRKSIEDFHAALKIQEEHEQTSKRMCEVALRRLVILATTPSPISRRR
jgi:hypothetical protein